GECICLETASSSPVARQGGQAARGMGRSPMLRDLATLARCCLRGRLLLPLRRRRLWRTRRCLRERRSGGRGVGGGCWSCCCCWARVLDEREERQDTVTGAALWIPTANAVAHGGTSDVAMHPVRHGADELAEEECCADRATPAIARVLEIGGI